MYKSCVGLRNIKEQKALHNLCSRYRWDHNIKLHLKEMGLMMYVGFIWLRTGTSGGLL
jgi:hypothetical protein